MIRLRAKLDEAEVVIPPGVERFGSVPDPLGGPQLPGVGNCGVARVTLFEILRDENRPPQRAMGPSRIVIMFIITMVDFAATRTGLGPFLVSPALLGH